MPTYSPMNNNFEIAKELLTKNGKITGLATGISMKPLLRSGKDNAVIVPKPKDLKKNDVVLYRRDGTDRLILHRIIKVTSDGFIIRGKGGLQGGKDVNPDDIIGILKGFYRKGKYHDCEKSTLYALYVLYIRISYPARFLFVKSFSLLKRILHKIKRIIIK